MQSVKIVYLPGADTNITVTRESRVKIHPGTRRNPTWWQTLRRQAGEDRVTVTLIVICLFALGAVIAAQAGIYWNW